MDPNSTIVIGAGMAGLAAARTLAEAGRPVALLDALPRVGGRILTVHDGTETVELGAEFVHGRPPELWSLIREAGLETYELDGPTLAFHGGQLKARDEQSEAASVLDPLESLPGPNTAPDLTFAEYLDRHPEISGERRDHAIAFVEGFNAADHRLISAISLGLQQSAEEQIEGDRLFRIRSGYASLPEYLVRKFTAADGQLHLSTLVKRIEWSRRRVTVSATQTGTPVAFEAARAVIALPLGVLQSHAVEFVPVPDPVHEARRLRMGQVRRFTLVFGEKFWTEDTRSPASNDVSFRLERGGRGTPASPLVPGDFSFLFSFTSMPPVWWTPLPQPSHSITGWIGGPRSESLFHLTPDQLGRQACETLAGIFGLSKDFVTRLLLRTHTHPWHTDVLFQGAYSYVPAGALDATSKMTLPADETLFFAGEHTDTTGHWGTVHAAHGSGLRAAHQILNSGF